MNITAILPARGRHEQTIALIPRLKSSAGTEFVLYIVVDGDPALYDKLVNLQRRDRSAGFSILASTEWSVTPPSERVGYWRSLNAAQTFDGPGWATHYVNLANDLLPGKDWLARAVAAYEDRYGKGDGMIGFNDGIHAGNHAAHFLISRRLLDSYGGWPVQFEHMFGDTYLCDRAKADRKFAVACFSVLYHNHYLTGAPPDSVYAEGGASWEHDQAIYEGIR